MPATTLTLPGGYVNAYGGPVDELYYFRVSETEYRPYASLAEANASVSRSLRSGRTVNVGAQEFWWLASDTSDAGLIEKSGGLGGAPDWAAGKQKKNALVYDPLDGRVYRVMQDMADSQAAPSTHLNAVYYKAVGPNVVGALSPGSAVAVPSVDAVNAGLTAVRAQNYGRFRGPWAPGADYAALDVVLSGGLLYYATLAFTSGGAFDPANWTPYPLPPGFNPYNVPEALRIAVVLGTYSAINELTGYPDGQGGTTSGQPAGSVQGMLFGFDIYDYHFKPGNNGQNTWSKNKRTGLGGGGGTGTGGGYTGPAPDVFKSYVDAADAGVLAQVVLQKNRIDTLVAAAPTVPADTAFTNQASVSITHNQGRYMLVSVFNSSGQQVFAEVACPTLNTVVITFNQPLTGTVVLR